MRLGYQKHPPLWQGNNPPLGDCDMVKVVEDWEAANAIGK